MDLDEGPCTISSGPLFGADPFSGPGFEDIKCLCTRHIHREEVPKPHCSHIEMIFVGI